MTEFEVMVCLDARLVTLSYSAMAHIPDTQLVEAPSSAKSTDPDVVEEPVELQELFAGLSSNGGVPQTSSPTDEGRDAYVVLAGFFLAEVFTWAWSSRHQLSRNRELRRVWQRYYTTTMSSRPT